MAQVLGFNPQGSQSYTELLDKSKLQQSLIEELAKLNARQEEEIKRLVGEYDKLYEKYQSALMFIQKPKADE